MSESNAPDEYKRSDASEKADAAIERVKEVIKSPPLPKPEKGGKPKRIGKAAAV